MARNDASLKIENAKLIFLNFEGRETKYNRAGKRNFGVIIQDDGTAEIMEAEGWNVKTLKPRDEEDEPKKYIKVNVNFDHPVRKPNVYLVTRHSKTKLDEETIACLDYAEINNVDVVIRPSEWDVNGKSGISGYLKTMYVTIEEDEFAEKYAEEEFPCED